MMPNPQMLAHLAQGHQRSLLNEARNRSAANLTVRHPATNPWWRPLRDLLSPAPLIPR